MPLPALKTSSRLRYFTFFYMYLMQGIPAGFALTAIANYLVGKGVSSSSTGTFASIVGLPWILQFVWGPLIDRYQYSIIGHRKQWIVLSQFAAFLASLTLFFVNDPVSQISLLTVVFFTHSIFASVQDASVDAMAISVVPKNERGRLNAFMRGGFLSGISFGAAALSFILHRYNFTAAVAIQSLILLLFTIITFFIKLDAADPLFPSLASIKPRAVDESNPKLKVVFTNLWRGITAQKSFSFFCIIAGAYTCFSIFIRSFSFHMIHELKWPDNQLSVLQGGWGSLVTFGVIISGGVLADKIGADKLLSKVLMALCLFLLVFNSLSFLWINKTFSITGLLLWNFADPLLSVAAFPLLMGLCRHDVEGSQFTAYMALINFCDVAGSFISGWALRVIQAPVLGFICGACLLAAVVFLAKISPKEEQGVDGASLEAG